MISYATSLVPVLKEISKPVASPATGVVKSNEEEENAPMAADESGVHRIRPCDATT